MGLENVPLIYVGGAILILMLLVLSPSYLGKAAQERRGAEDRLFAEMPRMEWFTLDGLVARGYERRSTMQALERLAALSYLEVEPLPKDQFPAPLPGESYGPATIQSLLEQYGFRSGNVRFYRIRLTKDAPQPRSNIRPIPA